VHSRGVEWVIKAFKKNPASVENVKCSRQTWLVSFLLDVQEAYAGTIVYTVVLPRRKFVDKSLFLNGIGTLDTIALSPTSTYQSCSRPMICTVLRTGDGIAMGNTVIFRTFLIIRAPLQSIISVKLLWKALEKHIYFMYACALTSFTNLNKSYF